MSGLFQFLSDRQIEVADLFCRQEGEWPAEGLVSNDMSAIVCKGQWLDIYKGSNDYYEAYVQADADAHDLAKQWNHYFNLWRAEFKRNKIEFLSIVVPNKASILHDLYPLPLPKTLTPVLHHMLDLEGGQTLCPLDLLRDERIRKGIFRRNDSHLAPCGSLAICASILEGLGYSCRDIPAISRVASVSNVGDLGVKFDPTLPETYHHIFYDEMDIEIDTLQSAMSNNYGMIYTTHCAKAVIPKRILVVGNSYFDRIPSWGLSPVFGRIFRDMMFHWSSEIGDARIADYKPDIVVFQTCERFLGRVPQMPPASAG